MVYVLCNLDNPKAGLYLLLRPTSHTGTDRTQLGSLPRDNWTGKEPPPYQPTFSDGWQIPEPSNQVRGSLLKALVSGYFLPSPCKPQSHGPWCPDLGGRVCGLMPAPHLHAGWPLSLLTLFCPTGAFRIPGLHFLPVSLGLSRDCGCEEGGPDQPTEQVFATCALVPLLVGPPTRAPDLLELTGERRCTKAHSWESLQKPATFLTQPPAENPGRSPTSH